MVLPPPVTRALRLALKLGVVLAFAAPLVTRLVVGWTFWETGSGKLAHPENVVQFFTTLGIPMPELNAAFVARLEYWGGLALIAGLATRFFAFMLSSTMVVALLTADKEDFLEKWMTGGLPVLTEVSPFLLLMLMSWLLFYGPGWASVDAVVAWFARRRGLLPELADKPAAETSETS